MIYTRKDIIPVNEDYINDGSFARILYESEINYQIIFESIIENDMKMINDIKNDTLNESRIEVMNEFSFKEFINKLIQKFKAFLSKLKGAVLGGIQKLILYINSKENKELINRFNNLIKERGGLENLTFNFKYKALLFTNYNTEDTKKYVSFYIDKYKKENKLDRNKILSNIFYDICPIEERTKLDENNITSKEYQKIALRDNDEYSYDNSDNDSIDYINNEILPFLHAPYINNKYYTTEKKRFENELKDAEKYIRQSNNLNEHDTMNLNIIISAYETALNIDYVTNLKMMRQNADIARHVISEIIKQNTSQNSEHDSYLTTLNVDDIKNYFSNKVKDGNKGIAAVATEQNIKNYRLDSLGIKEPNENLIVLMMFDKKNGIGEHVIIKFEELSDNAKKLLGSDLVVVITDNDKINNKQPSLQLFDKNIKENKLLDIKFMLKDATRLDPSMKLSDIMIKHIQDLNKNLYNKLFEKHDGEKFELDRSKWDTDYIDNISVKIIDNFSHERWDHLRDVTKYVKA